MYDCLIVGSGLYGAVYANKMKSVGKSVLVIDKRNHIAGNCYTYKEDNIDIHAYGPHVFHTNNKEVWQFVNQYAEFNQFKLNTKANYKGKIYSLPVNLNTFYEFFGAVTPKQAKKLEEEVYSGAIYNTIFYGYSKKQWHREPKDLPPEILKRIPVRFNWDNNYFNDSYQGIPINGYTEMIGNILKDIPVELNTDFKDIPNWRGIAKKLIYTGPIDEFFNYELGNLDYLSLQFDMKLMEEDYQGCAVMNYTDEKIAYTRIVEHKFFNNPQPGKSWITVEYPIGNEKFYPVNTKENKELYQKYEAMNVSKDVKFGGRLGKYKYQNMDEVILEALYD